jgi:hypothetical protein
MLNSYAKTFLHQKAKRKIRGLPRDGQLELAAARVRNRDHSDGAEINQFQHDVRRSAQIRHCCPKLRAIAQPLQTLNKSGTSHGPGPLHPLRFETDFSNGK